MPSRIACRMLTGTLGLIAAINSGAQNAELPDKDRYIGIGGDFLSTDQDARGASKGHGLQLLYGWQIARSWNLEISGTFLNLETGNDTMSDFYRTAVNLDLMWVSHLHGWTPFAIVGVGGAYNDVFPNSGDGVDPTANAGIGIMSPPLGQFGLRLRAETRLVYDNRQGNPRDLQGMVGIVIPLRGKPAPIVRTEIRNVEVVREVIREVPAPAPAARPIDSDGDGVDDARDRCPNTLPRTRVDTEGCAMVQAIVVLQGVHFETGSARLSHESLAILTQAAAALQGQPSMAIEVRGHTDAVGKDADNQALSRRRAQSVMDFLIETGIAQSRLSAVGFGESRPVADNGTAEGRATNRRVEFRVLAR